MELIDEEPSPLQNLRLRCEIIAAHLKMKKEGIEEADARSYVSGMFDDRSEQGLIQYIKAYNFLTIVNKKLLN